MRLSAPQSLILTVTLGLLGLLWLLLSRSTVGLSMRATAMDADTTSTFGVNTRLVVTLNFVIGSALAGAAGALFATSTEGRALLERLKEEARPETERAAAEWEPVLREVGRAVRLAVRELETATVDLRARIGEIAAERPDDEVALVIAQDAPADPADAPDSTT